MSQYQFETAEQVRSACHRGEFTGPTCGQAPGFTQANLVILPEADAWEFLLFCQKNPKPCPLLEMTEPGVTAPPRCAPGADLRTQLPRYRIWRNGELFDSPTDILEHWRDDFVSFVIGCSFTFEDALLRAGIPVRHIQLGLNVAMYRTSIPCQPAGRFSGPMVVSMHPMKPADAIRAVQVTSRYPAVHGAPVHIGFPEDIGIFDLGKPDYGDPTPICQGELPVFWACGVTPQAVIQHARPEIVITHSPGCMFITDLLDESLTIG